MVRTLQEPEARANAIQETASTLHQWLDEMVELSLLSRALELERNSISFDEHAMGILGRIYDRGYATCEDLAEWLTTPEEWIAFSRLQRARLLYDTETEFQVSREGRALVRELLNEGDTE